MPTLHEDKHSQPIGKGAGILSRVTIETPATQPGSHYALIPARMLLALPGGELLVLAVLLSQRRSNGTFLRSLTFGELARSIGFCGKTLGAHIASLRSRGLVHPSELKPTAEAITKRGERFAKVRTDRASVTGCAAFRLHAALRLFTDSKGGLRASRRYLASAIGRSTRTTRRLIGELRAVGYAIPARVYAGAANTFRSGRKKVSAISSELSRKSVRTRSKQPRALTETEVANRKRKARSQLARLIAQEAPA